jgi:hypothetical protein
MVQPARRTLGVVPLEGHWQRQQTPIRGVGRRQARIIAAVAGVLAAAAVAILIIALAQGDPKSQPGCVTVTVPSSTGGATLHACGARAAALCRSQAGQRGPSGRAAAAECRRAGYG